MADSLTPSPRPGTRPGLARLLLASVRVPLVVLVCAGAGCQFGDLISEPPVGTLSTSVGELRDSAAVGSRAVRTRTITISGSGEGVQSWRASRAAGTTWLSLSAESGSIPSTLTVSFNPVGLAPGIHRDTVVIAAVGGTAAPVPVPVEFTITECAVAPTPIGSLISDSLALSDCESPTDPDRFTKLYRISVAAGDSVSLLLATAGFDGVLRIHDTPDASGAPVAQADECIATTADVCLLYLLLPPASYVVQVTTQAADDLGTFSLSIAGPRPPSPPAALEQLRQDGTTPIAPGASLTETTVGLGGLVSDPDPLDRLVLEVELRPVGVAFLSQATSSAEPVTTGQQAVALATGLSDDTGYHWQARTVDQTGRGSPWVAFGSSGGLADFHVAVPEAPDIPGQLSQMKSDVATRLEIGDTTDERTVVFTAVVSDRDPSDEVRLEVEVQQVGTAFSDRAVGSSVQVPSGGVAIVTITGLSDDADYHWQARAIDVLGNGSPWVPFGQNEESDVDFRVAVPGSPNAPMALSQFRSDGTTPISVGEVIDENALVVSAVVSDPDQGDLVGFEVAILPAASGFTNAATHTSALVPSGSTASISVTDLDDDTDYHWRARTIDQSALTSPWVSFGGNADGEVDLGVQVPATTLAFTAQPGTSTAGSAIVPAVAVTAREPSGATDTSFTQTILVSLSPGTGTPGAVLSGVTSIAAIRGVATFSSLSIDLSGAGYRFTATSNGLVAESSPFEVEAASAGQLTFTAAPPTTAQSGAPLSVQPELQLVDSIGNPVNQAGVTVTAAIVSGSPGASLSDENTTTDSTGVATFGSLTITGLVGDYRLQFSAAGVGSVTSEPIAVSAGPAARLELSAQPSSAAQNGVTLVQQPAIQLEDVAGNPVGPDGLNVTAAIDSGGGTLGGTTTAVTDINGTASFSDLSISGTVGDRVLRFTSPGLADVRSGPITVGPGPATTIAINDGDNQSTVAGTSVAVPPSVIITDANSNRVPGVAVTFAVTAGGGSVTPATPVVTDVDGIARVTSWTVGNAAGTNTLDASVSGLNGSPVTFTATATPGAAGMLAVQVQPSAATQSGLVFAQQPSVQVQDQNGNAVAQAGVEISAALASGPVGSLDGDVTALTDTTGLATFTDLGISGLIGAYTLSFSGTGLTGAISDSIVVSAGSASKLALLVQPSDNPKNGLPFEQQPSVQVQDASGNRVFQSDIDIAVSVLSGEGVLGGTTTVTTDPTGTAVFTNLSITGLIGDRTLIFAASGLQSVVSNTVSLGAGEPSTVVIVVQPSSSVNNTVLFERQPRVEIQDQSTNTVPASGTIITASIASGGGALNGTLTATTDASGAAAFTDLAITGLVGPRTLAFSATGLSAAVSDTVDVSAGPAVKVGIALQPATTATNGVVLSQQPVVEVQDASGNTIVDGGGRGDGVPITASIASGSGTLSGVTTVVTASGVASYTDLVITGQVGTYVLEFTSPNLTGVTSTDIVLAAGAATALGLTTQPSDTVQTGMPFARQPVIQVIDQSGNAVSAGGIDVAAAILSGGGLLSGTTPVTTDANGVAAFTDLAIVGVPGDRVLLFAAGGLQSVSSNTVTVIP